MVILQGSAVYTVMNYVTIFVLPLWVVLLYLKCKLFNDLLKLRIGVQIMSSFVITWYLYATSYPF
jgi:apolipoprotein N-acyltransferase